MHWHQSIKLPIVLHVMMAQSTDSETLANSHISNGHCVWVYGVTPLFLCTLDSRFAKKQRSMFNGNVERSGEHCLFSLQTVCSPSNTQLSRLLQKSIVAVECLCVSLSACPCVHLLQTWCSHWLLGNIGATIQLWPSEMQTQTYFEYS